MKKEEIRVLSQLVRTMEDSVVKLEGAFKKRDVEEFKKVKKEVLNLQKKISTMLE